jgi:tetraacyldisaccharide 4'-kinase
LTLYSGGRISTPWPGFVAQRRLAGAVALDAWWAGEPVSMATLLELRNRRCLAMAGLAQPERFFDMLRAEGLQIQTLPLADHADLSARPWPEGTPDVLLTEKDAVKLPPQRTEGTRVWVVALDFSPELAFEQALRHEVQALLT